MEYGEQLGVAENQGGITGQGKSRNDSFLKDHRSCFPSIIGLNSELRYIP